MSLGTLHVRWSLRIAGAVTLAAVFGGALAKTTAEHALGETDEELGKAIARSVARRCGADIERGAGAIHDCLAPLWEEDRVAEVEVRDLDDRLLGRARFHRGHASDRRIKHPVPRAGAASSAIVVVTLTGASIERARRAVLVDTIVSAAAFALLAIVLSLVATLRVVRPLRRLAEAEARIAAGDLDVRLPEGSERELAELVQSFNRMVEAVRDRDLVLAKRANDLATSLEALRRLQETKERLTAMVVHDLRDPLSAALVALEAIDDGPLAADDRELLEGASRRGRELVGRIQEILEVARLEAGRLPIEKAPLCLATIARDVARDLAPLAAGRSVGLAVEAPDEAPAPGDPSLLVRAVGNLVSNAIRFAPKGTAVAVRVVHADGEARVHVDDAGPGVPAADRARIFEPFARLDQSRAAGVGLGLSFVSLVAQGHGGSVAVSESPEGGARFTLAIPAS